jgi:putative acetyltransferase
MGYFMEIRDQAKDDAEAVYRLVEMAFDGQAEADLVAELEGSGDVEFALVAEAEGQIIGQILFSRLQSPERSLALAPVSVVPDRQNTGVGSLLVRTGIERSRRKGWGAIFLLGEPDYYNRFGFATSTTAKFETPYPKDYFMALELRPGFLAGHNGAVTYPTPFLSLE